MINKTKSNTEGERIKSYEIMEFQVVTQMLKGKKYFFFLIVIPFKIYYHNHNIYWNIFLTSPQILQS